MSPLENVASAAYPSVSLSDRHLLREALRLVVLSLTRSRSAAARAT